MIVFLFPTDSRIQHAKTSIVLGHNELEITLFAGIIRYVIEKTFLFFLIFIIL